MTTTCTCGRCGPCRLVAIGRARRKYHWTNDLRMQVVQAYAYSRNKRQLTAALDRLVKSTAWPRWAFKNQASRLGIITGDHRRGWTAEEVRYLEDHAGAQSTHAIANRLCRSLPSVAAKMDALELTRKIRDGYTIADLARCLGVRPSKVCQWESRRLLGRARNGNGLERRFQDAKVARFIRAWPHEYDLRRVDQTWYKSMVFGCGADLAV